MTRNTTTEYLAQSITVYGLADFETLINENLETLINETNSKYEFNGFTVSVEWNSITEDPDDYLPEDRTAELTFYKEIGNLYILISVSIGTREDETHYACASIEEVGLLNAETLRIM